MPQRKPLEELPAEEKERVLSLQRLFPNQYKRYLELLDMKKAGVPAQRSFGSDDLMTMSLGETFEDILRSGNEKGDSFVTVYRNMVRHNLSIQKALNMADPTDQVDKRTLQRHIDEAYIKFSKSHQFPNVGEDFYPIVKKLDFSVSITEYVDEDLFVVCNLHQSIDKEVWIYSAERSYSCYSIKEMKAMPVCKAFWQIEKMGTLRELSCESQLYWKCLKSKMDHIFNLFPSLKSYANPYVRFFKEENNTLYYAEDLFRLVPGGRSNFFKKYNWGSIRDEFLELKVEESSVLPAEETHILQSQDNSLRRLNMMKNNGGISYEDFRKFRMTYSGTTKKYFMFLEDIIDETSEVDPAEKIAELEEMLYITSSRTFIPAETLLYLFVQYFGSNSITKFDAWKYDVFLSEYLKQILEQANFSAD